MVTKPRYLSEKSVTVLRLIADGHSYSQIVDGNPDIKYRDIFDAAEEALRLNDTSSAYEERLESIKKRYPRAYERWTQNEDARLVALHAQGLSVDELATRFQRQPSAIRSRLDKLAPKIDQEPA
jgi:uncharacterized protein (DUF433 family)